MNKHIKLTRVNTNLQVRDEVKNIYTLNKYRVAYIDVVETKAILVSISHCDCFLVIDLGKCDDLIII